MEVSFLHKFSACWWLVFKGRLWCACSFTIPVSKELSLLEKKIFQIALFNLDPTHLCQHFCLQRTLNIAISLGYWHNLAIQNEEQPRVYVLHLNLQAGLGAEEAKRLLGLLIWPALSDIVSWQVNKPAYNGCRPPTVGSIWKWVSQFILFYCVFHAFCVGCPYINVLTYENNNSYNGSI